MNVLKSSKEIIHKAHSLSKKLKLYIDNSYYPDDPHKSTSKILFEMLIWFIKYKEINRYYFLYGFDRQNSNEDQDSYEDLTEFSNRRSTGNRNGAPNSQILLLRDKLMFFQYMKMHHQPVPEVFAARIGGKLYSSELKPIDETELFNKQDYFLKDLDGECGNNIEHIIDYPMYKEYITHSEGTDFIFQEKVIQNPEMNRLNPNAVNTIRLVTFIKDGEPIFYNALLRIGTKSSTSRDNTSQGGVAVGIHQDGTLTEYGIRKPHYGGRTTIHPDTGVVFAEFKIPYYEQAIQSALEAHKLFYRVKSIGWDIAITPEGPVFIEGNDNWELQSFQALYGGQRSILKEFFD